MLDTIRSKLARAISPSKAITGQHVLPLSSNLPANTPIYPPMTVSRATREGYRVSVYVYRAVRTIIQAASAVPWIVIDNKEEPIAGHPLELLLRNPNPEFSGQDLIEVLIAHLELVGNALWQPLMVGGRPRELWPVMPDMVRPVPSDVPGEWLKGWEVTDWSGGQRMLPPTQFIHFMQTDPGNPYWGIGPLMAAARTVDTDNEAQDTQKISMQNRGIVDGVFTHDAPLTQEQFEEARRQVRERFLDKSRRREPWVLGAGAKWNQMSMTPVEMDYIASRLANMRAIAAAFGLDPWWMGDKQASTFSNVAEARRALYEDVVIPLLDDVKSTINLKLAPMFGAVTVTYNLSGIPALREDFGKKTEQASRLWAMGVPFEQINSRLEMGFEAFPGWNNSYLPLTLLPAGASPPENGGKSYKSLDLESEEAKTAEWKALDRRRIGWWGALAKRIQPLYEDEGKAILKAVQGADSLEAIGTAAERVIRERSPEWEKTLTASLAGIIEDFGEQAADSLGQSSKAAYPAESKWRFDPFSAAARAWIARHGAESVTSILDTNLGDVQALLLEAQAANTPVSDIGEMVRTFYSDRSAFKAFRVARTEVGAAAGFGQREAAKQSGVVESKRWLSSRDPRVRDSHQAIDGESQPLDSKYSNGLMYPCDPSGDPAESIMCRCGEQYFSK